MYLAFSNLEFMKGAADLLFTKATYNKREWGPWEPLMAFYYVSLSANGILIFKQWLMHDDLIWLYSIYTIF